MDDRVTFRDWPYLVVPCVGSSLVVGTVLVDSAFGVILAFTFGALALAGFRAWTAK